MVSGLRDGGNEVFKYVGQFWKYLQIHDRDLAGPNTMVLGDFNSNTIWDKPDRWWSHSGVVDELAELDIHSVYHYLRGVNQGSEPEPTFFHQRNINKPYHIDYVFACTDLLSSIDIIIGKASDWLEISDHMPLLVTLSN